MDGENLHKKHRGNKYTFVENAGNSKYLDNLNKHKTF